MDGWWMDGWMDGWAGGRASGRAGERAGERLGGWMDKIDNKWINKITRHLFKGLLRKLILFPLKSSLVVKFFDFLKPLTHFCYITVWDVFAKSCWPTEDCVCEIRNSLHRFATFLGTFLKPQKERLLTSSCPTVPPSLWNDSAPLDGFSWNLIFENHPKNLSRKVKCP